MSKEQVVTIASTLYNRDFGDLGVRVYGKPGPTTVDWTGCRDVFHRFYDGVFCSEPLFFFVPKDRQTTQGFLAEIESHLRLRWKSVILPTTIPQVVCVYPAPFWRRQSMRLGFLTAALRAADEPGKDMLATLLASKYLSGNPFAVERFLAGYTLFTGGTSHSWQNTFNHLSEKKTKRLLRSRWLLPVYLPWMGLGWVHFVMNR